MTSSWGGYGPSEPAATPLNSDNRNKRGNSRQLLSCTKCRERKVKCDRTKPCSACCARGHPKECEFIVGEGNEYSPIQQSYEIRQLRAENDRLRKKLQDAQFQPSDDEDAEDAIDRRGTKSVSRSTNARQRRFKTGDRVNNLYFGTPGLANIISDFANIQLGSQSLTHTIPRGRDMYGAEPTTYPFHTVTGYTTPTSLLELLPPREEVLVCLELFQRHDPSCSILHTPHEATKKEVERFLADAAYNAEQSPDMLALLFVTLASGLQMGLYARSGGQWIEGAVKTTHDRCDVFISASMQALRLASFMSRPTLLAVQTLIMMGPYLTNSGRFLDAWTLFGTTIRVAHSIGLHRDPGVLDPTPPPRECTVRRTLWWWMLHMDQQYSVTLGRPLGISGVGDCLPQHPFTTNQTVLRLSDFINRFTVLARQILSSNKMMSVIAVDGFTDEITNLWETMPDALQFNESWIRVETPIPEWPLEVMSATLFAKCQSFLILLNRQRVERTQAYHSDGSPTSSTTAFSGATWPVVGSAERNYDRIPYRGKPLVIHACVSLLHAFLFFYHRQPGLLICWAMGQQAFNASMILILDALETRNYENEIWVNQAFAVFMTLCNKGVHKLAGVAVQKISAGLNAMEDRREQSVQAAMSRRPSGVQEHYRRPGLELDTASMSEYSSGDTIMGNHPVMGNTGMYLLEDAGLQNYPAPSNFQPLEGIMPGSAHPSDPSNPPTPKIAPPTIPVSQITAAPFPVMSPPTIPVINSPFAVGFQPRMASSQQRRGPASRYGQAPVPTAFTPINATRPEHGQQSFSQLRGSRHSHATSSSGANLPNPGAGPRSTHRLDKPPRSHQRRK